MSTPETGRRPSGDVTLAQEIPVPSGESRWVRVTPGQIVQLVDVQGHQVGDFMAYRPGTPDEYLSPAHTCSCLVKLVPTVGDALFSNHRLPLMRVEADDVGSHDFVVPCCDPERYSVDYGIHDHRSCLAALQEGMDAFGGNWPIRGELAANIFMNNVVTPDGRIETHAPPHPAGSAIDLLVLEELVVGLVACPQDLSACNDFDPTDMAIRIWDRA